MLKAVIFDLDGTLVNTLEDLGNSTNHMLSENGFPIHTMDKYNYFVGNGIPKLIERALPETERSAENIKKYTEQFTEYYSKHFADKSAAYGGIAELVAEIKKMGLKTAVVTNKAQAMTDLVISKVFGSGVFDSVVGKRDENPAKPDPKAAFVAMSEMEVNPDECVFVGDSSVDILTARNCGAYPVGVLWGFRTRQELENSGARLIISEPEELVRFIFAVNGGNIK